MAPITVLSTVSLPALLQYGVGTSSQVSPIPKNTRGSKLPDYNCSLLSDERRCQSRFRSKALLSKGGGVLSSGVAFPQAELAADADTGSVIEVQSAEEMARHLQESGDRMVVVSISTRTCGPCKLIAPKVIKMSTEYPDVLFLKINGDLDNGTRALMREWSVKAVPTFRFYSNGKLVHSHSGAKEDELRAHFLIHYMNLVSAQ